MLRRRRVLGFGCLVGAGCLGVWLINLSQSLNDRALAHHLPAVKGGVAALLVVLLSALTAIKFSRGRDRLSAGSVVVQMLTLAVVVVSAATEWFLLVPHAATDIADYLFASVVAVTAVFTAVASTQALSPRAVKDGMAVGVGLLTLSAVAMALTSPPTVMGTDQRLVWVGLDIAELGAVGATGLLLLLRRSVLVPATTAACLFLCDALINIGVAGGHALALALLMACLELPAAGLCVWLGYNPGRFQGI